MNVYLISFTSKTNTVSRADLQNYFDTKPEVLNWFGVMPQAILVTTNNTASVIVEMLLERFGNNITFLITKTEPNQTRGFISNEVWEFINSPKPSAPNWVQSLVIRRKLVGRSRDAPVIETLKTKT